MLMRVIILLAIVLTVSEAQSWTSPEYDREHAPDSKEYDRTHPVNERLNQDLEKQLSSLVDPRFKWVEMVITYAITVHCAPSGKCAQNSNSVPINAEVIGKPFLTMQECVTKAKHDTELLLAGKKLSDYTPGPIIGNYRTFRQPKCYPVQQPH